MESTASFGYWLQRRRKALDLTQEALARQVGCAVVTIRKIEADEIRPSVQIAQKLAECLAIAPEDRAGFLQAARAERSTDRLALPTEPVERTPVKHLADAAAVALLPTDQRSLPSGTVTFLFTDIEGSTTLWEQHPQAMRAALARHNTFLRDAVEAHQGAIFKTVGDAICAAFASAPDALATALDAQHAMVAEDWGVIGVLRVRMALHTGTAQARGDDYVGPPLNRIARLVGAGHGGQVLLSRATQELVRDELPQGVALRDLGQHRLKDLTRPEHIFQLVAADLPADFPPLTTLASHPTNLPVQPTPLIGREEEVEQLCALLRRRDVRMATLTGPGGSGKTRLALQAAADLLEEFTHGVWFVDLAPIGDPGLVVATIAQLIGVHQAGSQPLLKTLQTYLREKQMLLLLDNFEQVLAAALHVTRLLAAAPDVKTLVTSRAPLHLSGEHEFVVPPLALPARKHVPRFEQLTQYDAVRLFIERAQAARADFVVTNENAPAVAEICHRLDGLPLAIELAAARIKLFTPQALLARLGSRLKLLTGGARDLPARQQTLRSTIDWSYNLLSGANQTLFARVAVFVGGYTLEAADRVCNAIGTVEDTLDELAGLLDQSLLRDVEGPDGEPRFVLLETIREYALERLTLSGAREALQTQHADYYLMLAEAAEAELRGPRQMVWLKRLDAEHGNFRAALSWALERGEGETAARLGAALGWFWFVNGHLSEGRRWLVAALVHGSTLPASLRAKALKEAGELTRAQGDYEQAIASFEESLALYQGLGDKRGSANALISLGHTVWRQGDFMRAKALSEESLALFRELEDPWGIAKSLNYLGDILVETHDYELARALHEESLALRREIGHIWGIAQSLNNLGWVAVEQGDHMRAAPLFAESLALFQELGDKRVIWDLLHGMARVAEGQGHSLRAARLYGAEENVRATIGLPIVHSSYRTKYERSVAAVRAQLDEATFAAAWAEGRAMSLEQATAYALNERDT